MCTDSLVDKEVNKMWHIIIIIIIHNGYLTKISLRCDL